MYSRIQRRDVAQDASRESMNQLKEDEVSSKSTSQRMNEDDEEQ